jgi:hypothetical protein
VCTSKVKVLRTKSFSIGPGKVPGVLLLGLAIVGQFAGSERARAHPSFGTMTATSDRRKMTRHGLRCRVLFFRQSVDPAAEGVTQNVSSMGFYCLSRIALDVGESLACLLTMPFGQTATDESLTLECLVRVVRRDNARDDGWFGIGCRIESYHAYSAERCRCLVNVA